MAQGATRQLPPAGGIRLDGSGQGSSGGPVQTGGPLLQEGADALPTVGGSHHGGHRVRRRFPAERLVLGHQLVERGETGLHRDRSVGTDLLGQRDRSFLRLPRFAEQVDQTELVGAPGVERAAGQDELAGDVGGERPRASEQAGAGRNHADAHLREAEARLGRGDHHVARQHDLEPTAECEPLDCGDERLAPRPPDDPVLAAALRHIVAPAGEVTAGAEHLARAGQDARPEIQVIVQVVEGLVELVGHDAVDGVALLGPIERDDEDVPVLTAPHQRGGGVGHAGTRRHGMASTYPAGE